MLIHAVIGFLGGLITGISPCILPVLPVIFFSGGVQRAPTDAANSASGPSARPYLVIAGLVLSFASVTLLGSAALSALGLPQDFLRWAGLVVLVLIGLGLIMPPFENLLEKPFAWIPQRHVDHRRGGFLLGLALGAVYVPCAGPVLAAIAIAGSTGKIGVATIVLTMSFSLGAAIPLLCFALAGRGLAERVAAFREHQHGIRVIGGVLMIALAVGLVFNLSATLQRAVPDYTAALNQKLNPSAGATPSSGPDRPTNGPDADSGNCIEGATLLQNCGPAPDITGITGWLNTPHGQAIDLKSQRGKVVLIDFWAYSCINCQRSIPHIQRWYNTYKDRGFEVIGVHAPEFAFEKVTSNLAEAVKRLGITYPIAQDNDLSTWTNYHNEYWPAHYLIDANGVLSYIKFGEGDYDVTEKQIRQLLQESHNGAQLPAKTIEADQTPSGNTTPETYLGAGKQLNYAGPAPLLPGESTFASPPVIGPDSFALEGRWNVDDQAITAVDDQSSIRLNYHATHVYLVAAGQGTVTVDDTGQQRSIPISGAPTLYDIHDGPTTAAGTLSITFTKGLQGFSFSYG